MRIAIATDHRGFSLKATVISCVENLGHIAIDHGPDNQELCDYPDFAATVAESVSNGDADRGVLVCGTGIGMCMVANKYPGVRAANCHSDLWVEMSRRHNDANVLCLPADMLQGSALDRMIDLFLNTEFEVGGRHETRVQKITEIERDAAMVREPESMLDVE